MNNRLLNIVNNNKQYFTGTKSMPIYENNRLKDNVYITEEALNIAKQHAPANVNTQLKNQEQYTLLQPIYSKNTTGPKEITGFIKVNNIEGHKYETKIELVNKLHNYVKHNKTDDITKHKEYIKERCTAIDSDIEKLKSIKNEYIDIINNIDLTDAQTCKKIIFEHKDLNILPDIQHLKTQHNNIFRYELMIKDIPIKNRKIIDTIYSQILLPVQIDTKSRLLIINYQHNKEIANGNIIGYR